MSLLCDYLDTIVEPTFEDFCRNPKSMRHAFLACVAAYHAIDRAGPRPGKPGNLKKQWREASVYFLLVEAIACKLKHVVSDLEREPIPEGHIPRGALVAGGGLNSSMLGATALNGGGLDPHNLHYVIGRAIAFIREQDRGDP
jgi:hypothetical protein